MISDSGKILIFGGTTEGRTAAERLLEAGVPCTVSVATHYGEEVLSPHPLMTVHMGRLDRSRMAEMMRAELFSCVIDATHPYAQIVSKEIEAACRETGLPCLRIQREEADVEAAPAESAGRISEDGACVYVSDIDEAGAFLSSVPGHILVTTGSKELVRFAKALGDPSRITARVLPAAESLRACTEAGLVGKQIFAMQGPFDLEMNCAQIHHTGAAWLLTKETGAAGGYPEKMEAVRKCGIRAVVIRTPGAAGNSQNTGHAVNAGIDAAGDSRKIPAANVTPACEEQVFYTLDLEQTIAAALQYAAAGTETKKRRLYLIGIGVGAPEAATGQAQEAIASAQVLFGAKTVLDNLTGTWKAVSGQTCVPIYDSTDILQYLAEHPYFHTSAVAYSGDSGFYSGAASMLEKLKSVEACDYDVRVICGISSVSWFAARAGIPWQNWKILSSHGRFCNVTGQVRRNRECFLLLSGAEDLRRTGTLLADAQARGMIGKLHLIYGYELSRPEEEIRKVTAQELTEMKKEGLYVLYIRHDDADRTALVPGLADSAFVRGKAPMTSSEIRALSLCRLGLTAKAQVWDVGAGTGSVSIEAALTCPEGKVWSVEFKKDALALLEENRAKFCLQNMEIVEGRAPQALRDLPAPTHVFIGGSGGEISEIIDLALSKNPEAKIVVNCITSETLSELQAALKKLAIRELRCTQVIVNREEMLGRYHYLRAGNPVFIISFTGAGDR